MRVASGIDSTHCLPVVVVTCDALSGSVLNACVSPVVSIVHTVYLWRSFPVRLSESVLNVCVSPMASIVFTVYLWWLLPVGLCQEVC